MQTELDQRQIMRQDGRAGPRRLERASHAVIRAETAAAGALVALVLALMVLGTLARAAGNPLIWTDEAAINAMIWAGLVGGSAGFGRGQHMAILLLPDAVGPRARLWLALAVDMAVLAVFAVLGWLVWRWFDLPGLLRAGSAEAYAQASFNFLYLEPTQTMGLRKVWLWLALPLFVCGAGLHGLAALARDLARLRRQGA